MEKMKALLSHYAFSNRPARWLPLLLNVVCITFAPIVSTAIDYEDWKGLHFDYNQPSTSLPEADPDEDGCDNLMEYALGTDPWSPLSRPIFDAVPNASGFVSLPFPQQMHQSDIMVLPFVSSDLQNWYTGPSQVSLSQSTNLETLVASDVAGGANTRFIRLTILDLWTDSDGDTMPDSWETLFGLNPSQNDASGDLDGDGVSNLVEFLQGGDPRLADNPNNNNGGGGGGGHSNDFGTGGDPGTFPEPPLPPYASSLDADLDGVMDLNDDYPWDGATKRRENVGLRHYGLFSMAHTLLSLQGNFPIRGAVGGLDNVTEAPAIAVDDYHRVGLYTLVQGVDASVVSYQWRNYAAATAVRLINVSKPEINLSESFGASDINPSGTLVGTWSHRQYSTLYTLGFVSSVTGGLRFIQPPAGGKHKRSSSLSRVSWDSEFFLFGTGDKLAPNGSPVRVPYHRSQWLTSLDNLYDYLVVNPQGKSIASPTNMNDPHLFLGNDPIEIPGVTFGYDVNASNTVVGRHDGTGGFEGTEYGAVWKFQLGSLVAEPFHQLWIPDRVKPQVGGAIPRLINNSNEVLFDAAFLLGDNEGEWKNCFAWISESAKTTQRSFDVSMCVFGDFAGFPRDEIQILRQNNVGTLAVAWNGQPALAIPCEFTTTDILGGFDYPLTDDPPKFSLGAWKDQDEPEWWVSVTRNGSRQHVHLNFASDDAAKLFKVRVAGEGSSYLSVTPRNITTRDTKLTLTAQGGNLPLAPLRTTVIVESRDVSPQIIRKLDVMMVPEYTLPVRICYLYDPDDGPDNPNSNAYVVPQEYRDTAAIISMLNDTFRQCGVKFEADLGSGSYGVHFDVWSDNERLDGYRLQDPEIETLAQSPFFDPSMLTIFVVKRLGLNGVRGVTFTNAQNNTTSRWIAVQTGPYFTADGIKQLTRVRLACCHEVGHVLKISSRNYGGTLIDPDGALSNAHDAGMRPRRYGYILPLMFPVSQDQPQHTWIRHEDWDVANDNARLMLGL